VHASLVHEEEFRNAFEKYGELCNPQIHGVPSVNILPESSSAFVNFSRYEDANAARKGLQGKLVGGAGPLRINASDLMQEYEQQQQQQQTPGGIPGMSTGGVLPGDVDGFPVDVPSSIQDLCGEEGPLFELLGGEIYLYDAGEIIKCFESRPSIAPPMH